jgi:hypothetical protein
MFYLLLIICCHLTRPQGLIDKTWVTVKIGLQNQQPSTMHGRTDQRIHFRIFCTQTCPSIFFLILFEHNSVFINKVDALYLAAHKFALAKKINEQKPFGLCFHSSDVAHYLFLLSTRIDVYGTQAHIRLHIDFSAL